MPHVHSGRCLPSHGYCTAYSQHTQPCQSLFVAPCSHVWHYKCIRPILNGPTWPNFLCPNCRAVADLEEDVEDPGDYEDWDEDVEQINGDSPVQMDREQGDGHVTPRGSIAPDNGNNSEDGGVVLSRLQQAITNISITESLDGVATHIVSQTPDRSLTPPTSSVTQPVSINASGANGHSGLSPLYSAAQDGQIPERAHEGPMTPRNDAGPFVLDGSAGRATSSRVRDGSPDSGSSGVPSIPPVRFD